MEYGGWPIAYDDLDLEIRRDPQEPEGYGLFVKKSQELLLLPRGTLKDVATGSRVHGRQVIQTLLNYSKPVLSLENFFKETSLNYDSLIAAIDKAYINEEKRRGNLL